MKGTMCCYQRPIQKPGPLMISGCISTYEFSSLNISESAKASGMGLKSAFSVVCYIPIEFLMKALRVDLVQF